MARVDITGGCLCGAIRYSAITARDIVTLCHCTECRRFTGHHWAAVRVLERDLQISGSAKLAWYAHSETARRGFCADCGSSLIFRFNDADFLGIAAGSIDTPTGLTAGQHIFCNEKGDYYEIADGVPQSESW